ILLNILGANSVVVPNSSCFSLDNSSHVVDFVSLHYIKQQLNAKVHSQHDTFEPMLNFGDKLQRAVSSLTYQTDWVGHPFEFEGKDSDLVVRFCKDVESRSQMGYINFGRFDTSDYFVAGSGHINFVQGFYKGDLLNCERSYDKMGHTAQVNIICGSLGCICNVTYESSCRAIVELAIPCKKQGPRVFEGFTIGFRPHSREIVQNGMTHLGFDKAHHEFSFSTEQMHLTLYVTAIASLSKLVQKPTVKVLPEKGLELQLSGSAVAGRAPTTLTPSTLVIDWKCVVAQNMPYEVEITIPIENYEAVQFTLTKMCDYKQNEEETAKGWATFGVISFILVYIMQTWCVVHDVDLVLSVVVEQIHSLFCPWVSLPSKVSKSGRHVYCFVFHFYSFTNSEYHCLQHGLDALPGITVISACLQTITKEPNSYHGRPESDNSNDPFLDGSVLRDKPANSQVPSRRTEAKYGSI
ncbi:LOW QUALITY PROTEIN: hypothetical protein V2J09_016434, partial [Rumex salicifolius]